MNPDTVFTILTPADHTAEANAAIAAAQTHITEANEHERRGGVGWAVQHRMKAAKLLRQAANSLGYANKVAFGS